MAPSKRTVQFEFLVEADSRQIDRFHDTLKRVQQTTPVTESVLTSLREELTRFSAANAKTENSLQGQISALRDASRNADLTQKEYVKLRTEIGLLEREYKDLTTGIVGVGKAYEQAGRQAEAFSRRAQKIRERQAYEQRDPGFAFSPATLRTTPQVGRDASGRLIAPGSLTGPAYGGIGDAGLGQFGPGLDPASQAALRERIASLQQQVTAVGMNTAAYGKLQAQIKELGAEFKRLESLESEALQGQSTALGSSDAYQKRIAELRQQAAQLDILDPKYTQLRSQVALLEREYADLTKGVVGVGRAYEQAGRQAEAFSRRAQKIAERQRYMADGSRPNAGSTGQPQVARDANGNLIGFPGQSSRYAGMGDAGLGQFGPSERGFRAATELKQAQEQILAQDRQYYQQSLEAQRRFAAQQDAIDDEQNRRMLADNKRAHEAALADFDRRLEDRTKRKQRRRNDLRELGTTASAIGIGGFFGGPEGLAGSVLGGTLGALGGPGGMAAGAAIGASVGLGAQQLRMQATMVADVVSQLNLAKMALAQVSSGQAEYNQRLEFARKVSSDYSLGLQATIQGYAQVTAAAAANNLTTKETETVYRGMVASGVAFGRSQDELKSIITATTQILSKGKLSAEELSGQLGERIPGAVARFAAATGRSLAQLSKDLRDGTVKIDDFVKFAQAGFNDYDAAARLIGSSPEKAGERLQLALTRMGELYGGFFQALGAGFQDSATQTINWVISQENAIKTLVGTLLWGGRQIKQFFDNAFAGIRFIEQAAGFLPGTAIGNAARGPLQAVLGGGGQGATDGQGATGNFFADRMREGSRLFPQFTPTRFGEGQGGGVNPGDPLGSGAADKEAKKRQAAADKAQRLAEQQADEDRRRQETLANNAIRLADRVFEHQQSLIRKRYELENELIEATRRAQEAALIGPAREALGLANNLKRIFDSRDQRLREADMRVAQGERALVSARESAANTARYANVPPSAVGGGSGFMGGARTGWRRDRDAEQSGFDVVLPGGVGARVPNPVSSLKITGVGFQGRGSGSSGRGYGNYVTGEFVGIDGKKYEMLLGHFNRVDVKVGDLLARGDTIGAQGEAGRTFGTHVTTHVNALNGGNPWNALKNEVVTPWVRGWGGRTQPGVAAGERRNITDMGQVNEAAAALDAAKKERDLEKTRINRITGQEALGLINTSTEAYKTQTQTIQDQIQEFKERNRLQMEGVHPEVIDQQIRLNEATLQHTRWVTQLKEAMAGLNDENDKGGERRKMFADVLAEQDKEFQKQISAQQTLNALQNEQRNRFDFGDSLRSGINGYIESIGTLDEAVQSLTQSGFGGLSTAIRDLVTTGSTDFKTFATNLLADMAEVIVQQLVVANLMQIIKRALNPAASAPGGGLPGFGGGDQLVSSLFSGAGPVKFAKGGVMTAHGPLKALPYARGGIANTPQVAVFGEGSMPEAFVPLPDGRRIPVNLQLPYQGAPGGDQAGASPLSLPYAKGAGGAAAVAVDDKPLRIEYARMGSGDLPFVTEEQHRKGMAQTAAATRAATLAEIRRSPATRRRIGM
jgi:lambda family phage tail tape measure protein